MVTTGVILTAPTARGPDETSKQHSCVKIWKEWPKCILCQLTNLFCNVCGKSLNKKMVVIINLVQLTGRLTGRSARSYAALYWRGLETQQHRSCKTTTTIITRATTIIIILISIVSTGATSYITPINPLLKIGQSAVGKRKSSYHTTG